MRDLDQSVLDRAERRYHNDSEFNARAFAAARLVAADWAALNSKPFPPAFQRVAASAAAVALLIAEEFTVGPNGYLIPNPPPSEDPRST